jgi:hypothetical protein
VFGFGNFFGSVDEAMVFDDGGAVGGGWTCDCRLGETQRTAEPKRYVIHSTLRKGNIEISSYETG